MLINYSREGTEPFKVLSEGDVFYCGMAVWMKVHSIEGYIYNAVNLVDGTFRFFTDDAEIFPKLKAMLFLNDNLND